MYLKKPVPFPVLVSAGEMRQLEERAFAAGYSAERLMDGAARGMASVLEEQFPVPGTAVIFAGKGHNGGDALELARLMAGKGWRLEIRLVWPKEDLRPLTLRKYEALEGGISCVEAGNLEVPSGRPLLLIDAILGTGAGGALQGNAADAVRSLNALRDQEQAFTVAVDLPSGLSAEPGGLAVTADLTLTLGWPKDFLFLDGAAAFVGQLRQVPLKDLAPPDGWEQRDVLVTMEGLRSRLPGRPPFSRHKGDSGRIGILAGSIGLTGAARLTATAAGEMGGGLVTLFCPAAVYPILAASCPPEVMVRPVRSCREVMDFPLDALGVGPGMGSSPLPCLAELLVNDPRPMVVDADALNQLATLPEWSAGTIRFGGPRLLTPHPGELARLTGSWKPELQGAGRRVQAQAMADQFGVTLLAKSARSLVVETGRPAAWNGTGHPLMARGGMGDGLTGMLSVFAAQGWNLYEAAAMGSWLLGRGAGWYHRLTGWEEPGMASEVILLAAGKAMAELRDGQGLPFPQ